MPIHLPPISRRAFFRRTALGAGALALKPSLFADTKWVNLDSWALFSDIHLAGDTANVQRGVNMAEHFATVSREMLALNESPAALFVMGDCALNSGEKEDYATVAKLLQPIRERQIPIHLLMGNHDNRERFWEVLQEEKSAKRPLADKQVAIVRTPRANWFILDSLEKTLSAPGYIGKEQLDWLGSALDKNPDKPALVLVHHNPGLGANVGLKDTSAFLDVIRPRKQVKAYIYGHTHTWKIEQDSSGIHFINLPPVAYVFHEGEPSGWVHAIVEDKKMRLELRCVDTAHKAHGQKVELEWRT
jgi:calcineurin-like phosphoesterase family protein